MRAVIYARYSSENQREASIEDQLEVCRRYVERQSWRLTGTYEDAAISGASRFRPGFTRLLADAETRRFDVVVCEAVDRLGRKLADVADFHDRLTFQRVQIHTTSMGLITPMHVGIMGTMAQMTLSDLREKTKRGQLGRARAGRIPGGLAYGYEVIAPAPGSRDAGERRIKPAEAEIVRHIFQAYAAGKSPRHIARELNGRHVPGPGGRPWGDTTLRGQADRGTGLLNNTLYIGRLSWNRCSYVKDPRTGRRVARVNPLDHREEVDIPELRIVDQVLWDAAQVRREALRFEVCRSDTGQPLNGAHRRKFLLSGLLTCGVCGGGYTIMARDRYGCAAHRSKNTCDNGTTTRRQQIETRVLAGLKDHMLAPDLVAEFVRAFTEEMASARRASAGLADRLRGELADVERRLDGVLKAIENGAWSDAVQARLRELEGSKASLTAELSQAAFEPTVIELHPNAVEIYRHKIAGLETALAEPGICAEAGEALAALIEAVVLTPDCSAPDGLTAELHGDMAMILVLADEGRAVPARRVAGVGPQNVEHPGTCVPGRRVSVVAGTGFEPVTFRL